MNRPLVVNRFSLDDPEWEDLEAELPEELAKLENELEQVLQKESKCPNPNTST